MSLSRALREMLLVMAEQSILVELSGNYQKCKYFFNNPENSRR